MRQTAASLLTACAFLAGTLTAFAGEMPASQVIIGRVGQRGVTEDAIIEADVTEFRRLDEDYARYRPGRELSYREARYELLQKQLDLRLDQEALAAEARARGIPAAEVLRGLHVDPVVTDAEAQAFYTAHTDRVPQPFAQVAVQVRQYLIAQRIETATRDFYDALRIRHGIASELPPYRVEVAAIGPSRGRSDAPVTIVEFGDFQCPYCRQVEGALHEILGRYPTQVRLVFRNLPLSQIHPNARLAATAAVCAGRQGQFWQMHDALYADQGALARAGLTATARRLKLDDRSFDACLSDAAAAAEIAADTQAAGNLGISGTPYFFVNGRPIDGSVPVEVFQKIIDSELSHDAAG